MWLDADDVILDEDIQKNQRFKTTSDFRCGYRIDEISYRIRSRRESYIHVLSRAFDQCQ